MFPDVSDVLDDFLQNITKRAIVKTEDSNFVVTETEQDSTIQAVVQPAQKEAISKDIIDWSLEYLQVHVKSENVLDIDDVILWSGKKYKMVQRANYSHYGYFELIAEEVKR